MPAWLGRLTKTPAVTEAKIGTYDLSTPWGSQFKRIMSIELTTDQTVEPTPFYRHIMSIELATGQIAELTSFHLERTYGGMLEGLPRAPQNARILAQTAWRMLPLWGERRVHLIPPVTRQESGYPILPELTHYAWLTCHTPIDPWPGASELVVAWFGPERPGVSLSALVTEAVRDLPWASLAMDADY